MSCATRDAEHRRRGSSLRRLTAAEDGKRSDRRRVRASSATASIAPVSMLLADRLDVLTLPEVARVGDDVRAVRLVDPLDGHRVSSPPLYAGTDLVSCHGIVSNSLPVPKGPRTGSPGQRPRKLIPMKFSSPGRADNLLDHGVVVPLSGRFPPRNSFPRALPWADMWLPFGANSKRLNTKIGRRVAVAGRPLTSSQAYSLQCVDLWLESKSGIAEDSAGVLYHPRPTDSGPREVPGDVRRHPHPCRDRARRRWRCRPALARGLRRAAQTGGAEACPRATGADARRHSSRPRGVPQAGR